MTNHPDDHPQHPAADDELLAHLGRALDELDPVPASLVEAGRAAWTWRTVDAELAALAYDSVVDEELVGVRGGGGGRQLTFELDDTVIDLEIDDEHAGGRSVLGQVSPASVDACEVHLANGAIEAVTVDDLGRFRLAGLALSPFRVVVRLVGPARSVRTDWIV